MPVQQVLQTVTDPVVISSAQSILKQIEQIVVDCGLLATSITGLVVAFKAKHSAADAHVRVDNTRGMVNEVKSDLKSDIATVADNVKTVTATQLKVNAEAVPAQLVSALVNNLNNASTPLPATYIQGAVGVLAPMEGQPVPPVQGIVPIPAATPLATPPGAAGDAQEVQGPGDDAGDGPEVGD